MDTKWQGSLHLFLDQPYPQSPPSSGNIVRHGVWKKGPITLGQGKILRWLVILVLLTSYEVGSPIRNMVDHTSNSPITFGKWNSQIGMCRHWTPDAPIRTNAPTESSLRPSPSMEALRAVMVPRVPEKTPTGSKCLGNALLKVWVSEGECISQNSSRLGLDNRYFFSKYFWFLLFYTCFKS